MGCTVGTRLSKWDNSLIFEVSAPLHLLNVTWGVVTQLKATITFFMYFHSLPKYSPPRMMQQGFFNDFQNSIAVVPYTVCINCMCMSGPDTEFTAQFLPLSIAYMYWFCISPGHVAGQFTAAPPTCPGDTFIFRCIVTGDRSGITTWRVGGSSECILAHSTAGATSMCGPNNAAFTATSGAEFGTNGPSFLSTLSGIATSELDGTLIECFGPHLARVAENMVGKRTLQVLGQYNFSQYVYAPAS